MSLKASHTYTFPLNLSTDARKIETEHMDD